jgi:hypothetical protein
MLRGWTFGPLWGFRVDQRFGTLRRIRAAVGKSARVTLFRLSSNLCHL